MKRKSLAPIETLGTLILLMLKDTFTQIPSDDWLTNSYIGETDIYICTTMLNCLVQYLIELEFFFLGSRLTIEVTVVRLKVVHG